MMVLVCIGLGLIFLVLCGIADSLSKMVEIMLRDRS